MFLLQRQEKDVVKKAYLLKAMKLGEAKIISIILI